ncbi:unnamed protein product [Onchocerca flexuosa]|uniref:Secreted protein n=1 Tax=Onchocerca flexuosa TaxID=387005 RepID=A0A183I0Z0_9BILA|nr:unnamed protein product [Onchocerca flexuosa]
MGLPAAAVQNSLQLFWIFETVSTSTTPHSTLSTKSGNFYFDEIWSDFSTKRSASCDQLPYLSMLTILTGNFSQYLGQKISFVNIGLQREQSFRQQFFSISLSGAVQF